MLSLVTATKAENPIIFLHKVSGISRPCFPSNSTCSISGTCVKLYSGWLQDLLLKCLSDEAVPLKIQV